MLAARLFVYFLYFRSIMFYVMKKIIFCILTLIALCFTLKLNGGTVFKGGENTVFYFSSSSKICNAEKPNDEEKLFGIYAGTKKGECCDMSAKEISKTLEALKAKIVFSESGANFENVYYYSPKIPDFVTVSGKKINVHVSYGKENTDKIKIASPINYGGY